MVVGEPNVNDILLIDSLFENLVFDASVMYATTSNLGSSGEKLMRSCPGMVTVMLPTVLGSKTSSNQIIELIAFIFRKTLTLPMPAGRFVE